MNKPLRVTVCSSGLSPEHGGSAFSEVSMCSALSRICEVTILCARGRSNSGFVQKAGFSQPVIEFTKSDVLTAWLKKSHWLHSFLDKTDVFHINGHWKWHHYIFARLCYQKNIPYVLHPRGMLIEGTRKKVLKRLFNWILGNWLMKNASRIIALSKFEVQQFSRHPIAQKQITIIPNGIPRPLEDSPVKQTFYSQMPKAFFLYIGRLEVRKNLLFLLDAYSEYLKKGGGCSLLLMGPVERGYDKQIDAKARALGLGKRLRILPAVYDDQKWFYMKRSKAVLYPTIDEPFGRVPFEAISAEVPTIVPKASGSAEYLERFIPTCVYLTQCKDSLASVLLNVDKGLDGNLQKGVQDAKHWVWTHLDWNLISTQLIQLYDDIHATRSSPSYISS